MNAGRSARLVAPGAAAGVLGGSAAEPAPLVLVPPGAAGDRPAIRRQAFGRRLRATRERCGVTLEEIAQATKVSASMLAALERGDASRRPKGIFRRAAAPTVLIDGSPLTASAIVGLWYAGRLIPAARGRAASWRRRRSMERHQSVGL